MKKYIYTVLVCFLVGTIMASLTSCSKEDVIVLEGDKGEQGEAGEQGPQGEQGEQGEQGPQGEQGEQGDTGVVNVITSDWFVIETEEWTQTNVFRLDFDYSTTDITQEVLDGGTVLVYLKQNTNVFALPATLSNLSEHKFYFGLGNIHFYVQLPSNVLAEDHTYRYVIIPPNGRVGTNMEFKNYQALCAYYGIKE